MTRKLCLQGLLTLSDVWHHYYLICSLKKCCCHCISWQLYSSASSLNTTVIVKKRMKNEKWRFWTQLFPILSSNTVGDRLATNFLSSLSFLTTTAPKTQGSSQNFPENFSIYSPRKKYGQWNGSAPLVHVYSIHFKNGGMKRFQKSLESCLSHLRNSKLINASESI